MEQRQRHGRPCPLAIRTEALRVKILEILGSEGPKTTESLHQRLPFPEKSVDRIVHELEARNVISVGFFTQTDDAELILKVDEHRITGGEERLLSIDGFRTSSWTNRSRNTPMYSMHSTNTCWFKNSKNSCTESKISVSRTGRTCNLIPMLSADVCFTIEWGIRQRTTSLCFWTEA